MRISKIINTIHNQAHFISFWLTSFIVVTIPFQLNFGNLALILASVFSIFTFKKQNFKKLMNFGVLFPIFFFLITIGSSLKSKDIQEGLVRSDLELLPVLLVIILINQDFNKKKVLKLLHYFTISTVISTMILIIVAVYNKIQNINSGVFHDFTSLYDQHPVYYAMYISLSLFYILLYPNRFFKSHPFIKVIAGLCLLLGLVLCASKAVIFIVIIIIVLILLPKKKLEYKVGYIASITIMSIILYNTSFIRERFVDGLRFNDTIVQFQPTNNFRIKKLFTYEEKENISDLELRYLFLKTMLYHLSEDHKILFGYGQGDAQKHIDYYYYSYNLAPNWYEGFNVHNQYLHILITYGVFVLLTFLYYLFYSFKFAIKQKDFLFAIFLIISCFVFIFEVTLVRNKGIIFFYFFNTLFLSNYINFEDSNFRNKRYTKLSWRF